jgi:hypothetical protein
MSDVKDALIPAVIDREAPTFIEEGPALLDVLTDKYLEQFERGVANYQRWVTACYRLTRASHWIKHGERYSLQSPGAEALMNPLGINFDQPTFRKEIREDEEGSFYIYWCEGFMESRALGRRGYYIGYCDSRDQFFAGNSSWDPITGEGDIKKSSYSNWEVNGVSRMGGLRDPDVATLTAAGIIVADIQAPEFKKGLKEASLEAGAKSKLEEIKAWLMLLTDNDKTKAEAKLKELTAFSDYKGQPDVRKLSERQINILHPKLKKLAEEFAAKHPTSPNADKPATTSAAAVPAEKSADNAVEKPTATPPSAEGNPTGDLFKAQGAEPPQSQREGDLFDKEWWAAFDICKTDDARRGMIEKLMVKKGKTAADLANPLKAYNEQGLRNIVTHLLKMPDMKTLGA